MWETGSLFLTCDLSANHEKTDGLLISHGKGEEEIPIHFRMCLKDAFLTARETPNILPILCLGFRASYVNIYKENQLDAV